MATTTNWLRCWPLTMLVCGLLVVRMHAAEPVPADDAEAYRKVVSERAAKAVAELNLSDAAQLERVHRAVVDHYVGVHDADGERDAKRQATEDESQRQVIDLEHRLALLEVHRRTLGALASDLTAAQVDQIKDQLTYNVLQVTYNAYVELVPQMTDEQRRQIRAWLWEARDYAMDAGSSDKKHAWFGKYKGRINNYLSAAGVDLKQAEADLAARRAAE